MTGAAPPPSALAAWTCPLTGQLFVEPVLYLAPNDGAAQIYERAALEQQLASLGITGDDRGRLVPVEAVRFAVEAAVARAEVQPPAREAWIGGALAAAARAALQTHDLGPLRRVCAAAAAAGDALSKDGAALFVEGLPAELQDEAESILDAKQVDVTPLQARARGRIERRRHEERIAFALRWSARRDRHTTTPRSTRRISWDPDLSREAPFPSPLAETPHREWPLHAATSAPASPEAATETRGRFRVSRGADVVPTPSRADVVPTPPPTPPPPRKRPSCAATPPAPPRVTTPRSLTRFQAARRAAQASDKAASTLQRAWKAHRPAVPEPAEPTEPEPSPPTGRRARASMTGRPVTRRTPRKRAPVWASPDGAEAAAAAAAGRASVAAATAQAAAREALTAADAAEAIDEIVGAVLDTIADEPSDVSANAPSDVPSDASDAPVAPLAVPEELDADEPAPGPATPPARPAGAPHARPAKSPRPDGEEVADVSYTESELAVLCTPAAATASRELAADSISAARETPRPPSARRSRKSPRALASPLRCATNETPKIVPGPKPALPPRPKKISPRCVTAFPPADSPPAAKDSLPLVLPGGRKLPPVV